jgi:hypothetical protein
MIYKLYHNIYFAKDDEMFVLHFNWLFSAISLVSKRFVDYMVYTGEEKEKQFHQERVFAYELYRQWANILESECKEPLVLNAELDKIINEKIDTGENDMNDQEGVRRYPDLVLHEGQYSDNNQIIICEIKRNTNTQISNSLVLADLYKIACYMDENKFHTGKKPFKYGVFILLNGKLEQIKGIKHAKIKVLSNEYNYRQFKEEMYKHFDKIICVTYDGATLEYKTLKGLL